MHPRQRRQRNARRIQLGRHIDHLLIGFFAQLALFQRRAHDADTDPLGQNQDVTGLRQVVPFDACRMHEADRHQPV